MKYKAQYEVFFKSPAGISFLTWLQEQRTTEHEKSENFPEQAVARSQAARAYKEVLEHIDSMQVGIGKPTRSSSGVDT